MSELRQDAAPLGLRRIAPPVPFGAWYANVSTLSVCVANEGGLLHVSIAHTTRYPTWDEILAVRDWVFPDEMEAVLVLARKSEYVNKHPNCFHIWQSACGQEGR